MAPDGFGVGYGPPIPIPATFPRTRHPPPYPLSGPFPHQTRHPPGLRDPMGTRERGGQGRQATVLAGGRRRGVEEEAGVPAAACVHGGGREDAACVPDSVPAATGSMRRASNGGEDACMPVAGSGERCGIWALGSGVLAALV